MTRQCVKVKGMGLVVLTAAPHVGDVLVLTVPEAPGSMRSTRRRFRILERIWAGEAPMRLTVVVEVVL